MNVQVDQDAHTWLRGVSFRTTNRRWHWSSHRLVDKLRNALSQQPLNFVASAKYQEDKMLAA